MKNLSKQIVMLLAAAFLVSAASAVEKSPDELDTPKEGSGWEFEGTVGIESNYVSTGNTMSDDNPSLFAAFRATRDWFFVEATMHTLQSKFFGDFQAEWIPAIGVTHSFGEVDTYLTYRLYRYTGGTLWTGDRASTWNIDELAVGASWKGFYTEIAWVARTKGDSHDTLFNFGYEHSFGRFTLDAQVNFYYWDKPSSKRFNNFQLTGSYDIGHGVEPYAGFSLGGKNVDNESIDNKVFVGIRYNF